MFKSFIQNKLEKYVVKYFASHPEIKLVAVAGSVGKTSTKTAIATILSTSLRVRLHEGNHNTHMSAPVSILGVEYPENVHSITAWLKVFKACRQRIKQPADVDVIVQELGADKPGDIAYFGTYLKPHIGVVTAVTPEHMEFFSSIEKVAEEELALANMSELAVINRDDIEGRFADMLTNPNVDTYGMTAAAEYRVEIDDFSIEHGYKGAIVLPGAESTVPVDVRVVGEHSVRPVCGAITVAVKLGLNMDSIVSGVEEIQPVHGRMNPLRGQKDSILLDDTYNSSPASAHAALQALYSLQAPQRTAILGSMNELGESSQKEHESLGNMCDPSLLSWVVTIGEEAERFLAPAAKSRGCQVRSFHSAIEAGAFVHSVIEENAVVLAKGSQGDIYAEEALKILLHNTADEKNLVRQSAKWRVVKDEFFSKFN